MWTRALNPEVRPVYAHRERLQAEFGERRADQMVNETRNLCLYPNVYLMDQFSTQIRVIRPIAVDKTEVTIWCFAPKGESDQPERCESASTRISLTSVGWGRRTTSKSSAPVSAAISAKICHGATSAAARCAGSMARMSMRNMPAFAAVKRVKSEDEALYIAHHHHWQTLMLAAIEQEQQRYDQSITQRVEVA